jgi:hypothetical protein
VKILSYRIKKGGGKKFKGISTLAVFLFIVAGKRAPHYLRGARRREYFDFSLLGWWVVKLSEMS